MLTRAQLMKMGAVLAVPPVFALTEALPAMAMNPKIYPYLHLTDKGVVVAGPFNTWSADEESARVEAILVQGRTESQGFSVRYKNGTGSWTAFAPGQFKTGPAIVHATAVVYLVGGGVEFYDWQGSVILK